MELTYLLFIIAALSGVIAGGLLFLSVIAPGLAREREVQVNDGFIGRNNGGFATGMFFLLLACALGAFFLFKSGLITLNSGANPPQSNKAAQEGEVLQAGYYNTKPQRPRTLSSEKTTEKEEEQIGIKLMKGHYIEVKRFNTEKSAREYIDENPTGLNMRPLLVKGQNLFSGVVYKVMLGRFSDRFSAEKFIYERNIYEGSVTESEEHDRLLNHN